jgi:uncharacterized protein (TIGR03435 family)
MRMISLRAGARIAMGRCSCAALVVKVAVAAAALALAVLSPIRAFAVATAAQDGGRFDVASVKPNRSGAEAIRWTFENGRFTAVNVTVRALVASAYGLPQQPLADFQISGGPSWLSTDRFDVLAQAPAVATGEQSRTMSAGTLEMLRALLEERFQLRAHFESREQSIYALVLSRANQQPGPGLRRRTLDCAAIAAGTATGEPCGGTVFPGQVSARGVSMTQFISGLARLMPNVGRLVVDRTGLTGTFDVDLKWTPDQMPAQNVIPGMPGIPPIDPNGPSLFTALHEQLGLKLESGRGPVQVLVIDSAAQPAAD